MPLFILITVFLTIAKTGEASVGDRSQVFNDCLDKCWAANCTSLKGSTSTRHELTQPIHLTLLGWNCVEECKYSCMWVTVDKFLYSFNQNVPQFYGKWPFVRIWGIQEPASVFASLLNLAASIYMIRILRRQINMTRNTPFKFLWYMFSQHTKIISFSFYDLSLSII